MSNQNFESIIEESLKYIRQNLAEKLSIQKVAKRSGYSASWIEKKFIEHTGAGIFAQIQRLRIEKAKQLLQKTRLSISEIAYEVGYNSHTRFTLAFVRLIGIPPAEYRKRASGSLGKGRNAKIELG